MGVLPTFLAAVLAGLVLGEPAREAPAAAAGRTGAEPTAPPTSAPIRRVILRVEGLPWEEVHEALAPRLPGVEIVRFEDAGFAQQDGELLAYVELLVAAGEGEPVDLTIVLSDRRAYLRHFSPEVGRSARSIAITVTNTLLAIEQEQLVPDEQDQEIPRPPSRAEPRGVSPVVEEPEPPPFELGLGGAMHPTFGLAPAGARGFAALAGELRVSMQHRRGTRVEMGLRLGGWAREGYRLWRNRLCLAAGHAWRWNRVGFAAVIGPTIEPWRVRRDGSVIAVAPLGPGLASPLYGGLLAVTPSLRFALASTVALGLGLRTELAVSVLRSGAAARVVALLPDRAPTDPPERLFGVGGLELTTALELTVWIGSKKVRG